MKKLLALTLALLVLAGCSAGGQSESPNVQQSEVPSAQPSESQSASPAPSAQATPEPAPSAKAEVIEFTVDASFFDEGITQDDLDESSTEDGFISATLNEDGSVTYVMTKEAHLRLMADIAGQIADGLKEMVEDESYPSIVDIKSEAPYTEFRVYLNTDSVGLAESFAVLVFYAYGGMYNVFNDAVIDDIAVYFINEATGDIIQESHMNEAG